MNPLGGKNNQLRLLGLVLPRLKSMIRKSMPLGFDPTGGNRFSEKIMLHERSCSTKDLDRSRRDFSETGSHSQDTLARSCRLKVGSPQMCCRRRCRLLSARA